jgi:hypothetical protein
MGRRISAGRAVALLGSFEASLKTRHFSVHGNSGEFHFHIPGQNDAVSCVSATPLPHS